MARDLHWVGGTADWDGVALLKWSLTEGGVGGEAIPTSIDNVFFDAGSGVVTVTLAAGPTVASVDFTGFTGAFAGNSGGIIITGNLTLGATTDYSNFLLTFTLGGSSGSHVLTTNGATLVSSITINAAGATWSRVGVLRCGQLTVTAGTWSGGSDDLLISAFASNNSNVRTLLLGSATYDLNVSGFPWSLATVTNLTFNKGTATIKLTSGSSNAKTFQGGGLTYHNFWNACTDGIVTITGSNGFADFRIDASREVRLTSGATQTLATLTVPNSAANAILVRSTTGGSAATIALSAGNITVKGVTFTDITVTGGVIFASTSNGNVDGGGNTGIIFGATPKCAQRLSIGVGLGL